MKKNLGFTLVELLAVITLLGLISLIVVPTVEKTIRDSKNKMYEKQKSSILSSLQEWTIDHKDLFYDNNVIILTIGDLKEQSYIDYDIKNPNTNKCISNNTNLKVTKEGKKYNYEIVENKLVDGDNVDCDVNQGYPSIYLLGNEYVNVEINTSYVDPGYTAKDIDDNDITASVNTVNGVNNSVLGSYQIQYKVTVNGLTTTKSRTVNIIDTTAPVITAPANSTISSSEVSFDYMQGVSATDNSGETITVTKVGDITFGVKGHYEIVYVAKDSSGNSTSKNRVITVQ